MRYIAILLALALVLPVVAAEYSSSKHFVTVLSDDTVYADDDVLDVTIIVTDDAIWRTAGYALNSDASEDFETMLPLEGVVAPDDKYLLGQAVVSFSIPREDFEPGQNTLFTSVYSCSNEGGANWDCHENWWQLDSKSIQLSEEQRPEGGGPTDPVGGPGETGGPTDPVGGPGETGGASTFTFTDVAHTLNPESRTATIEFSTNVPVQANFYFGTAGEELEEVSSRDKTQETVYQNTMDGLEPGMTYYYQVEGCLTECAKSEVDSFIMLAYPLGDVNRDESVDGDDVIRLNEHLLGEDLLDDEQMQLADVYADGLVNGDDLNLLQQLIQGQDTENPLGDVTLDGKLTGADDYQLRRYLAGERGFTEAQEELADVNQDGIINAYDWAQLVTMMPAGTNNEYKLGDVILNLRLTREDLDTLGAYLQGDVDFDPVQLFLADVNEDGSVTDADYAALEALVPDSTADNAYQLSIYHDPALIQQYMMDTSRLDLAEIGVTFQRLDVDKSATALDYPAGRALVWMGREQAAYYAGPVPVELMNEVNSWLAQRYNDPIALAGYSDADLEAVFGTDGCAGCLVDGVCLDEREWDTSSTQICHEDEMHPINPFEMSEDVVVVGDTAATLTWTTTEMASGAVYYGFDNPNWISALSEERSPKTDHSVELTDLRPDTLYYYQRISCSDAGCTAGSRELFTTLPNIAEFDDGDVNMDGLNDGDDAEQAYEYFQDGVELLYTLPLYDMNDDDEFTIEDVAIVYQAAGEPIPAELFADAGEGLCDALMQDPVTCYYDNDMDGYGDGLQLLNDAIDACGSCPADYVDNGDDCDDISPKAHPGASVQGYYGVPYRTGVDSVFTEEATGISRYDFNCDGVASPVPDPYVLCNDDAVTEGAVYQKTSGGECVPVGWDGVCTEWQVLDLACGDDRPGGFLLNANVEEEDGVEYCVGGCGDSAVCGEYVQEDTWRYMGCK